MSIHYLGPTLAMLAVLLLSGCPAKEPTTATPSTVEAEASPSLETETETETEATEATKPHAFVPEAEASPSPDLGTETTEVAKPHAYVPKAPIRRSRWLSNDIPIPPVVVTKKSPGAKSWAEEPFTKIEVVKLLSKAGEYVALVQLERLPQEESIRDRYNLGRNGVYTSSRYYENIRNLPTEVLWTRKDGITIPVPIRSYALLEQGRLVGYFRP